MRFFKYFSIAILIAIGIIFWQSRQSDYQILKGYIFGTYYSIKVRTPDSVPNFAQIIDKEFDSVNSHMSVFQKNSEINTLNQTKAGVWLQVSPELFNILKASQQIHLQSNGYFDPSVGRLVELWGFGINKEHKIPSASKIKTILTSTGFGHLTLKEPNLVKKDNSDTDINLSAIAKGYAVDQVAAALKAKGYKDFLVDIGGEVFASGIRSTQTDGWNIGIAQPSENKPQNLMAVNLKNMAVATSGDYRNFYYLEGKKYAHTIDPKTGYPVEHNLTSVTIFHESCMKADGYATAMMALGEKRGLEFANQQNLAAIFFVNDGNGLIETLYSKQARILIGE